MVFPLKKIPSPIICTQRRIQETLDLANDDCSEITLGASTLDAFSIASLYTVGDEPMDSTAREREPSPETALSVPPAADDRAVFVQELEEGYKEWGALFDLTVGSIKCKLTKLGLLDHLDLSELSRYGKLGTISDRAIDKVDRNLTKLGLLDPAHRCRSCSETSTLCTIDSRPSFDGSYAANLLFTAKNAESLEAKGRIGAAEGWGVDNIKKLEDIDEQAMTAVFKAVSDIKETVGTILFPENSFQRRSAQLFSSNAETISDADAVEVELCDGVTLCKFSDPVDHATKHNVGKDAEKEEDYQDICIRNVVIRVETNDFNAEEVKDSQEVSIIHDLHHAQNNENVNGCAEKVEDSIDTHITKDLLHMGGKDNVSRCAEEVEDSENSSTNKDVLHVETNDDNRSGGEVQDDKDTYDNKNVLNVETNTVNSNAEEVEVEDIFIDKKVNHGETNKGAVVMRGIILSENHVAMEKETAFSLPQDKKLVGLRRLFLHSSVSRKIAEKFQRSTLCEI